MQDFGVPSEALAEAGTVTTMSAMTVAEHTRSFFTD